MSSGNPNSGPFTRLWGGFPDGGQARSTNPVPVALSGTVGSATNITNKTAAIPGVATQVTLTAPSGNIIITNLSVVSGNNVSLFVDFTGAAATSSSYTIPPNSSVQYHGIPLSGFSVLGSAVHDNYSVLAV